MSRLPQEIIRSKRNGETLSSADIQSFVEGIADLSVSEGQVAAFAMAVFFKGMAFEECRELTHSMMNTGQVLSWDLPGPVVDKHSTGGVGDKISLMLSPMLAACGAYNPMISGRGLGHTGGTLDKLESIPGFNCFMSLDAFKSQVASLGCAMIGANQDLAPADQRLYSIRDTTATVDSVPLITASILSKKLAEGLDALVMDIKTGSGAFASTLQMAQDLASSIVNVAHIPTTACLTRMDEVLGCNAGNALEMHEAVQYLSGNTKDADQHLLTLTLCAEILVNTGLFTNSEQAKQRLQQVIDNGDALEIFAKMVHQQGGPADFCENTEKYLAKAPVIQPVFAQQSGYVHSMNARQVGMLIVELGGGRINPQDKIDPAVGLSQFAKIGERVEPDQPLAMVHAQSEDQANDIAKKLNRIIQISTEKVDPPSLLIETIHAQ
ncbi:MAG: thymidine phosphorylase [bacterium]